MENIDINGMLAWLHSAMRVEVINLTIEHRMAVMNCFVRVLLGKITVVRCQRETLFYQNFFEKPRNDRINVDGAPSISVIDF